MLCWSTQKFPPLLTDNAPIFCLILTVLPTLSSEVIEENEEKQENVLVCFNITVNGIFKPWEEKWKICKPIYCCALTPACN